MKRMLLLIVLSLILCLLPGCSSPPESKEQLTVELVRQLAEKGEGLTWDDLAPYEYDSEAGSGRVVKKEGKERTKKDKEFPGICFLRL